MVLITEMFCYHTRSFLQSDIWQGMCSCSSRTAFQPIMHMPQSSICARLHLNSYHLTYDLNLVDYKIWDCVQERVYQKPIREVDQLKQCLVEVWSDMQQTVIDAAIGEWRKRLRACVRAKGNHFEHLL